MQTGLPRVIGCFQLDDVLVDPGPGSCLPMLLEGLGDQVPRALLLTHIHLDHAGASGALVQRWPDLEVYVHERGAPHLIDPSRLMKSATTAVRRGHGPPVGRDAPGARGQPPGAVGRRAGAGRGLRGRLHARARLPPRLLPAQGHGVRGRRRRRADPAVVDGAAADAAARHRRRGVAPVDRARVGLAAPPAGDDPLRADRGRRRAAPELARHARRMGADRPRPRRAVVHRLAAAPDRARGRPGAAADVRSGGPGGSDVQGHGAVSAKACRSAQRSGSVAARRYPDGVCRGQSSCLASAVPGPVWAVSGAWWCSTTTTTRSITWPRRSPT